jgi:hypothetical protein
MGVASGVDAAMPRYRCLMPVEFIGRRVVKTGEEIVFLGWPQPGLALEPLNERAREIVAYHERFGRSPLLPTSPWKLLYRRLYLPRLSLPGEIYDATMKKRDDTRSRSITVAPAERRSIPSRRRRGSARRVVPA